MTRKHWALVAGLGLSLCGAGCDDTLQGLQKDTKENTEAAKRTAEETGLDQAAAQAGEEAKKMASAAKRNLESTVQNLSDDPKPATATVENHKADDAMGKAKARLEETGRDIRDGVKAAGVHVSVKQALLSDDSVDASHVNVDIDEPTRTVILRGSVPTAGQKSAAERIARARAGDYKVRNELAVIGGVS